MINHYQPLPTLREARIKSGWTQEKLAVVTDLTNVTISNIERGITEPQEQTRRQIEVCCGKIDWKRTREQAIISSNGHDKHLTKKEE